MKKTNNKASTRVMFFKRTGAIPYTVLNCSWRFSSFGWYLYFSNISLSEISSQFVINGNIPSLQASAFTFELLISQLTWKRVRPIAIYLVLGPGRPLFSCLWVVSIFSTTFGSIQRFAPTFSTIFSASFDTACFVFSRHRLLWSRFCNPFKPDIALFIVFCRFFWSCLVFIELHTHAILNPSFDGIGDSTIRHVSGVSFFFLGYWTL